MSRQNYFYMKKQKEPLSFTKIMVAAVMITYFIGVIIGGIIVFMNHEQLGVYLTFIGSATATTIVFYCWKAKAENVVKIRQNNPSEAQEIENM